MRAEGILDDDIAIQSAHDSGGGGGLGGLQAWLGTLPLADKNKTITAVCIVADSDLNHVAQFGNIVGMLNAANAQPDTANHYSIPTQTNTPAAENKLRTSIVLIPDGTAGCLETLLLQELGNSYPDVMACVDAYADCAEMDAWPVHRLHKAKVSVAISCLLQDDPYCSLGRLWKQRPDLIPVSSPLFQNLAQVLNGI